MLQLKSIKPCPFCGGKARLNFCDYKFIGWTDLGKKNKYRVQVICNRCKSRGKPIITDALLNANPWGIRFMQEDEILKTEFAPYIQSAIEAWNNRGGEQREQTL